jgi:2'-5' RNA ligase
MSLLTSAATRVSASPSQAKPLTTKVYKVKNRPLFGLARIRNELRAAFAQNGLGNLLDRRYKVTAAHMTALRFGRPEKNLKRLVSLLAENRRTDFGETEVNRLQLIWGNWYAACNNVRTLQEYPLSAAADPHPAF